jgi:hypothetical protein
MGAGRKLRACMRAPWWSARASHMRTSAHHKSWSQQRRAHHALWRADGTQCGPPIFNAIKLHVPACVMQPTHAHTQRHTCARECAHSSTHFAHTSARRAHRRQHGRGGRWCGRGLSRRRVGWRMRGRLQRACAFVCVRVCVRDHLGTNAHGNACVRAPASGSVCARAEARAAAD